jgi:predicted small lipoprotein YifL
MKKFFAALLTLAALALLTACADWSAVKKPEPTDTQKTQVPPEMDDPATMGIKVIGCLGPNQKGCK